MNSTTSRLTKEELELIRKRTEAATPFVLDCGDNSCQFATHKGGMRTNGGCRCFDSATGTRSATAAAYKLLPEVALARTDIPRLLDEIDSLSSQCSELRSEVERLKSKLSRTKEHHRRRIEENETVEQKVYEELLDENDRLMATLEAIQLHYQHPYHDHNWAYYTNELVTKALAQAGSEDT